MFSSCERHITWTEPHNILGMITLDVYPMYFALSSVCTHMHCFCQQGIGKKKIKYLKLVMSPSANVKVMHCLSYALRISCCVPSPAYLQYTNLIVKRLEHNTAQQKSFQNIVSLFKNMVKMSSLYHFESYGSRYISNEANTGSP